MSTDRLLFWCKCCHLFQSYPMIQFSYISSFAPLKRVKNGNGSISDKYSNLEINWILTFDGQSFPKVMSGIKSQTTFLLTQTDTWHFFSTTVCIDCQQHALPKHKLSNQKSGSIHLTLRPTIPFSVPTQISSVPFSSFLRLIGLSWRRKGRFSR